MNYLFSRCDDKKTGSLDQFPVRCGHIYPEPELKPNIAGVEPAIIYRHPATESGNTLLKHYQAEDDAIHNSNYRKRQGVKAASKNYMGERERVDTIPFSKH